MLQFLGSEDVWRTLRAISRKHKGPLHVAVPYIGDDCGKLLYLRRGDVLVVALTERNSRNGSVCPDEIVRLQKKRSGGISFFLPPRKSLAVWQQGCRGVCESLQYFRRAFR